MNCDYDPPTFCTVTKPRARKDHRCYECGVTIPAGKRYERVSGVWDGDFITHATCFPCALLRNRLAKADPEG